MKPIKVELRFELRTNGAGTMGSLSLCSSQLGSLKSIDYVTAGGDCVSLTCRHWQEANNTSLSIHRSLAGREDIWYAGTMVYAKFSDDLWGTVNVNDLEQALDEQFQLHPDRQAMTDEDREQAAEQYMASLSLEDILNSVKDGRLTKLFI